MFHHTVVKSTNIYIALVNWPHIMRQIKGYWGTNRHDVALSKTDQRFQDFVAAVENVDGVKVQARARHDWGLGIPSQDSGYDVRFRIHEATGPFKLFTGDHVVDLELRLNFRMESQDYLAVDGELPAQIEQIATELGYNCHQNDHHFVPDRYFKRVI